MWCMPPSDLILPQCVVAGRLELGKQRIAFYPQRFSDDFKTDADEDFGSGVSPREDNPVWVPDSSTDRCARCKKSIRAGFSAHTFVTTGKHLCRVCGGVFCNNCSLRKTALPSLGYNEPVRVCDRCFSKEEERKRGKDSAKVLLKTLPRFRGSTSTTSSSMKHL